jgi:hypothetical protein
MATKITKVFSNQEVKRMDMIKAGSDTIIRTDSDEIWVHSPDKGLASNEFVLVPDKGMIEQLDLLINVVRQKWDSIDDKYFDLTPDEIKEFKESMIKYPTGLKDTFISTWLQINAGKGEKLFAVSDPEKLGTDIAEQLHDCGFDISVRMSLPMCIIDKIRLLTPAMMKRREEYINEEHQQQLENIEKTGTLNGSGTSGGGSSECGAGCYIAAGIGLVLAGAALWWGYNNFLGDQYVDEPITLPDDY